MKQRDLIAGPRPNFRKIAPIIDALKAAPYMILGLVCIEVWSTEVVGENPPSPPT